MIIQSAAQHSIKQTRQPARKGDQTLASGRSQLSFRWKKGIGEPEVIAILYAVQHFSVNNLPVEAERLITALPMFSEGRLRAGLSTLIAHGLIRIEQAVLILAEDAILLDVMVQRKPILVEMGRFSLSRDDRMSLYASLGVRQPEIAERALMVHVKDIAAGDADTLGAITVSTDTSSKLIQGEGEA